MGSKYSRTNTSKIDFHIEGDTLIIDGDIHIEDGALILNDNSIQQNLKNNIDDNILASSSIHTADGFYELIKNNCFLEEKKILNNEYLEMYLALASFACEIYMKAILYNEKLHNGKIIKKHNLDELFHRLPVNQQEIIKDKIKNIETQLPEIGDMFILLRYNFEQRDVDGDYLVIFELMEELRVIAHTYLQVQSRVIRYANGVLDISKSS